MNPPEHSRKPLLPNLPAAAAARLCGLAAPLALALFSLALPACKAFKIDVGTAEPIQLDPIKFEPIDIKMRVDIYQYTGGSKEDPKAIQSVAEAVENQRNRMAQVQDIKNSRWVGEDHRGLLVARDLPAGKDGTWVQEIIAGENADREFQMLAATKPDPGSSEPVPTIEEVRRKQWELRVQSAFEGEWIEVAGEKEGSYKWVQKAGKKD